MIKEWFILVEGKQEGPFSLIELKWHALVNPDTLVWKEGFKEWVPARNVKELEEVFKDLPEGVSTEDRFQTKKGTKKLEQDQEVLTMQLDPFQYFIFLLLIVMLIVYLYIQFFRS